MKLRKIHLKGYKSIDGDVGQSISFGDVTVLLGANGSGKSNIVSLLDMLQCLIKQELAQFVGKQGVSRLLFYGPKKTNAITIETFFDDRSDNRYEVKLSFGLPDNLFISYEKVSFGQKSIPQEVLQAVHRQRENGGQYAAGFHFLNSQNGESGLVQDEEATSKLIYDCLSDIRVYQFNDTSDTAKIKDRIYVDDAKYLRHDAGNLAAFLKMLKEHTAYTKYYERIIRHIQRVMPQFGDFDLESIPGAENYVRLNWKDSSGTDYLFDPHQISDGSLRFMALATLLLQPPDLLPRFIVLDEPELGLHPAAIAELGGLARIAAQNAQVLLATQSTRLVDEFLPEELVIVEWDEQQRCSIFKELGSERLNELRDWLVRYSLSELWEKNVLGGRP